MKGKLLLLPLSSSQKKEERTPSVLRSRKPSPYSNDPEHIVQKIIALPRHRGIAHDWAYKIKVSRACLRAQTDEILCRLGNQQTSES